MELNPNHPVTQNLRENWHVLVAVLIHKMGVDHVVITAEDMDAVAAKEVCLAAHEDEEGLHLRAITRDEAEALARKAGGLLS